ncbi:DNA-3-methyladenine glycosylase 2 family protein [Vibrio porteresiae]|uniref:Ada metal-binding domain-containing protein n=1 Tax=Vibrio porteresiae DSM 19223 TaxID=1123496 RepID=A0ABZ0QMR0_9VIBR|nr:Ada metal-binding domain-containing protein [Vibrio porteresiae]WPC76805.1 Ada metal-binding domain-containing protein [Vibrio porteresiae DSM 19223]
MSTILTIDRDAYRQARLSRDARFDGVFFVAVKTTKIFCRPICPANLPKEENVDYYHTAAQAIEAGYRPCLRCHPDSAPKSYRWMGTATTFERAIKLIDQGILTNGSVVDLADRLGISERYLRQLFDQYLGLSPKRYALYQQLLLAKQLLHRSAMSVVDIAYACGFNSLRRFNDAFAKHFLMAPTQLRRQHQVISSEYKLLLPYKGKLAWQHMRDFYALRAIEGVEEVSDDSYSRHLLHQGQKIRFCVSPSENSNMELTFELEDIRQLRYLISQVRRQFDLDADTDVIEQHLEQCQPGLVKLPGIRLPGVWNTWEAGVRAILGQQVTIKGAIGQLNLLVQTCYQGQPKPWYFPAPEQVLAMDLSFLRMPNSRKETLKRFAQFMVENPDAPAQQWLDVKGIGPWTVQYAQLRGDGQVDCFLEGDLIVKKAMNQLPQVTAQRVSPWGSYATFHCWNWLS